MWMFPVALACGNTFVLKPSERDPTLSLRMAELLQRGGACPTACSTSSTATRKRSTRSSRIRASRRSRSSGSTPIAKYIYETGARHGKRVQALGGAKNHAVVLPDADLDFATEALIGAGYGSAGERCMAISAVVAVGDVGDALVEQLAERARTRQRRARATRRRSRWGRSITCAARDRITGLIDRGVAEGATLVVDGRKPTRPRPRRAAFSSAPRCSTT